MLDTEQLHYGNRCDVHCITQDFYVIAILLHGTHMHTIAILLSVYCLSHIQQEVENALEGLCNLLPSSISSEVGATKLVADMIVSSEHYCYTVVHSSFPFPSSLPPLSLLSPSSLPPFLSSLP